MSLYSIQSTDFCPWFWVLVVERSVKVIGRLGPSPQAVHGVEGDTEK